MSQSRTPFETLTDDQLVQRARDDRDAFGQLYDVMYPALYQYGLRRTGNRSVAEDMVSTVFLKVASQMVHFRGETMDSFRRWVFKIATNEMHATFRKESRRKVILEHAVLTGRWSQTREPKLDSNGFTEMLQQAFLSLNEKEQSIITLRYFSEFSYEDIAEVMSMRAGTVRTALSRALSKLRDQVGAEA